MSATAPSGQSAKRWGKTGKQPMQGCHLSDFSLNDMPSSNHIWGAYLRRNGFRRHLVDDHGQDIYTVRDFCEDNPKGTYILAIDGHVVCVQDGYYWASWDSGNEIPIYYWER